MQSIKDTYQRITDTIIEQLEAGTKPWIRPWRGNSRGFLVPPAPQAKPIAGSTSLCCGSQASSPATRKTPG